MSDATEAKGLPTVDTNEYGGKRDGVKQALDTRLFMQLLVLRARSAGAVDAASQALLGGLREQKTPGVVYADTMDPWSVGLLTWSAEPADFVTKVRPIFSSASLRELEHRDDFAMIGRSYGTGHDPDLEDTLLRRPVRNVLNEHYPWHVWYPLRRKGAFAKLEPIDQSHILREHAALGMAYGQQELAHDVRLACHGLDARDNEFVIGLVGKTLHPLSHLVQAMRKTRQTSEFIAQMGPFFVGHVLGRVGLS